MLLPHLVCGLLVMPDALLVSLSSGQLIEVKDFDLNRIRAKEKFK